MSIPFIVHTMAVFTPELIAVGCVYSLICVEVAPLFVVVLVR